MPLKAVAEPSAKGTDVHRWQAAKGGTEADHEEAPARGSTGAWAYHGEMAFYC